MALVALAAIVGSVMVAPLEATAQTTHEIQVGQGFFSKVAGESMRFFPNRLQAHPGDTLHFSSEGFHTATLLPANTGAQDWVDDNATGPAAPWSFVVADPDEEPGSSKANNAVIFPTSQTCGGAGQAPCSYDGTGVVNSGIPLAGPVDFSVTFDVAPGDFAWMICLIHPAMRSKVTAVPLADPASDPAEVAAQTTQQKRQDRRAAIALFDKLSNRQVSHRENGQVVKDVFVGFDTRYLSLFGMFPRKVNLRRGQTVRYHFDQLVNEIHTASLPKRRANRIANNTFVPGCDPDGDGGTAPDNPPDNPDTFCNDPSQLEFDIPAEFVLPAGNGRFTGPDDFETSGILGPDGLNDRPWDVKFNRRSNRRGFAYICMVHPGMIGRVVVR